MFKYTLINVFSSIFDQKYNLTPDPYQCRCPKKQREAIPTLAISTVVIRKSEKRLIMLLSRSKVRARIDN